MLPCPLLMPYCYIIVPLLLVHYNTFTICHITYYYIHTYYILIIIYMPHILYYMLHSDIVTYIRALVAMAITCPLIRYATLIHWLHWLAIHTPATLLAFTSIHILLLLLFTYYIYILLSICSLLLLLLCLICLPIHYYVYYYYYYTICLCPLIICYPPLLRCHIVRYYLALPLLRLSIHIAVLWYKILYPLHIIMRYITLHIYMLFAICHILLFIACPRYYAMPLHYFRAIHIYAIITLRH